MGVVYIYEINKPRGEKQMFKVSGEDTKGTNKVIRHAPFKTAQVWAYELGIIETGSYTGDCEGTKDLMRTVKLHWILNRKERRKREQLKVDN
jgi:hypothetical protein